jgi:hypothetical protein
MGYYTHFKIRATNPEAIRVLRKPDSYAEMAFDEDGDTVDSCKWYEHEEEIIEFSKLYPDVLFTLNGEGEESGDIWTKYFLNGKMQYERATIVINPFDPTKLK